MKITDLNKEKRIGANSLYIEAGPFKLVIDAGLDPKSIGNAAMPDFEFTEADSLDCIILTHCHLDHLGSLPVLARRNPNAPIYMSPPTEVLAVRMLRNSINVMKRQKLEKNIPELPLYSYPDLDRVYNNSQVVKFAKIKELHKDGETLSITFHPSGHIPGASALIIEYNNKKTLFSGDILFKEQHILSGAKIPDEKIDAIVLETTRGATQRAPEHDRSLELKRLLEVIIETYENDGCCLIPVFALGRMQEMLSLIHSSINEGVLPEIPVFCTGLGMDIANYMDTIHKKTGLVKFQKKIIRELKVAPPSRNLKPGRTPAEKGIYLLSSGMLVEHTPSYIAAASILDAPENNICFVGYCDPSTPGGALRNSQQGDSFYFNTLEYEATVNAGIHTFDLSGHADREELMQFAIDKSPETIFLTHGDLEAREWFFNELTKVKKDGQIIINPEPKITYNL